MEDHCVQSLTPREFHQALARGLRHATLSASAGASPLRLGKAGVALGAVGLLAARYAVPAVCGAVSRGAPPRLQATHGADRSCAPRRARQHAPRHARIHASSDAARPARPVSRGSSNVRRACCPRGRARDHVGIRGREQPRLDQPHNPINHAVGAERRQSHNLLGRRSALRRAVTTTTAAAIQLQYPGSPCPSEPRRHRD